MDEFGDWSRSETLGTGISFSEDAIEGQDQTASNTERIDLDEYPWAVRSLGEVENTPGMFQNSGNLPFFY